MSETRLYLFDDDVARGWSPFTLTRPTGELLLGCLTLRERAERALGLACHGHRSRRALEGFDEPGAPPVVAPESVAPDGPRLFLLSRVAVEPAELPQVERPTRLTVEERTVGWLLPDGAPNPAEAWLEDPSVAPEGGETLELEGRVFDGPWSLVAENPEWIARDVADLWPGDSDPEGVVRVGSGVLSVDPEALVEPGVVVDTRGGPVRLEAGARVMGPARLTGPLWIGADTTVLGGPVGTSSVGPGCKVRGELTDSILLGWSNKAHDGHLGHALVGRWVNLGAGTTNSDLKNNYGPVRVWTPKGVVDTGLSKVGCFLGDHVKTGIGTLLGTGAVIGAGSTLFGGGLAPTVVAPFSWGTGDDAETYRLEKFLEVADRMAARRERKLSSGVRRVLSRAWRDTRGSEQA